MLHNSNHSIEIYIEITWLFNVIIGGKNIKNTVTKVIRKAFRSKIEQYNYHKNAIKH